MKTNAQGDEAIKAIWRAVNDLKRAQPNKYEGLVRGVILTHGKGAKRVDELKPEAYADVLTRLNWYVDKFCKPNAEPAAGAETDGETAIDTEEPPETLAAEKSAFGRICDEWVWVVGPKRFIRRSDGEMWDMTQFGSNYDCTLRGGRVVKYIFDTPRTMRRYERMVFRPGRPEVSEGYNTWRKSKIIPKEGDTTLWDAHMEWLFPDEGDRKLVLDWLAWVYQNQHKKPLHALLLVGEAFGTGKSFVARVMEYLLGESNTQRPKNSSLRGEFNGWAAKCKLAIIEELMQIGRREVTNELRDLITEPKIEVNIKNVPAFQVENYMALMAVSNHPDALPLEKGDRRWMVIETPVTDAEKQDAIAAGYFARLMPIVQAPDRAALAAIAWQLKERDVGDYDARGEAPMTDAKETMIDYGATSLVSWMEAERSNPPFNRTLVNIADDIVPLIPAVVARESKSAEKAIAKFLKRELAGVPLGNQRIPGRGVIKLWAMNDLGRKLVGSKGNVGLIDGASTVDLYVAERDSRRGDAAADDELQ